MSFVSKAKMPFLYCFRKMQRKMLEQYWVYCRWVVMVMDKKRESVRNEERVFIARRKIGVDMEEAQQLVLAEDDFTHCYY